ncbi:MULTISPECIES: hypothetical protein [unclassified Streptomyces]|uniref:HIT family protein n=1 Tax=unclassified Streptomyces TaxID=2593676 RepID=UPI000DC28BC3|nr:MULTISPECIES: hypothetical protein [unclassified Streptomyces]RAJ73789.1 diadenosine tetraphosphate (Ap4A) HIT family hydrolase [Streptomyces sp. PsTaAH-137]
MTDAECAACRFIEGVEPVPGGTLLRTAQWVVQHSKGPLGLGTLAVMPVRHVVHAAGLTADESAELGPLLQRTSAAVHATMNPEQVYVCLWSHADAVPGHLHFVVQPACRDDMTEHDAYGPVLQLAMSQANRVPSAAAVEEVCARLRTELSDVPGYTSPSSGAKGSQSSNVGAARLSS